MYLCINAISIVSVSITAQEQHVSINQ